MPTTIPRIKFAEPRRNLPGRKGSTTPEDRFTLSFARAYTPRIQQVHPGSNRTEAAAAREVPVNGYGIADLVVIAWAPETDDQESLEKLMKSGKTITRAFECKLKNWRSALAQAARYRFFSHQAIVVVPPDTAESALPYLDTFKKACIGLWSFDRTDGKIKVFHTPRPAKAKVEKYFVHVGHVVHDASKKALPIQGTTRFPAPSQ